MTKKNGDTQLKIDIAVIKEKVISMHDRLDGVCGKVEAHDKDINKAKGIVAVVGVIMGFIGAFIGKRL